MRTIYLHDFNQGVVTIPVLPGGEFHPQHYLVQPSDDTVSIVTRLKNGDDVLRLLTVTNAIKNTTQANIELIIPYIPGGRQDRISNKGEAFTLKVYADLINSQNYTKVSVYDPHSDVTPALINNCVVKSLYHIMRPLLSGYDTIFVPDAGAAKKIYNYYLKNIGWKGNIIQCLKKRDTATGYLSGFEVVLLPNDDIRLGKCIILDDICDGGGTFVGLAEEIQRYQTFGLDSLDLYVTHGIFSKGFTQLFNWFDKIYTTTSWDSVKNYQRQFVIREAEFPNRNIEYHQNLNRLKVFDIL